MNCNPFAWNSSPAVRRYNAGLALTMCGYVLAVLGTSAFVHHHRPSAAEVYVLAAIPTLCIVAMLGVVVLYLREEKDEYQRLLAVRSLLVATFAVLALSTYNDFLRSYGHSSGFPPFTYFVSFWLIFGIANLLQNLGNRSHE